MYQDSILVNTTQIGGEPYYKYINIISIYHGKCQNFSLDLLDYVNPLHLGDILFSFDILIVITCDIKAEEFGN